MVKRTSFIALLLVMTPMIQGSSFKDVLYAALQQFSKESSLSQQAATVINEISDQVGNAVASIEHSGIVASESSLSQQATTVINGISESVGNTVTSVEHWEYVASLGDIDIQHEFKRL